MNYVRAQQLIDRGRGKASLRLGQPHDIYRLGDNAAVNFIDPLNKVQSGILMLRRPSRAGSMIEGTLLTVVPYEIVGDFRDYLVGDVFVQNDTVYGSGHTLVTFITPEIEAFCVAFHGPVKKTVAGRIDRQVQIYRPPITDPDANDYWAADLQAAFPLKLVNGVFQFGALGEYPALIPSGFSSHIRARGEIFPDIPSTTGEPLYLIYVPPLPGYEPREGDRIVEQRGARYVVHVPFEQEAGLIGMQLAVTREVAQL